MKNLEFENIIEENLTTVLMFAFSQRNLTEHLLAKKGKTWEDLSTVLTNTSSARAKRAAIELGIILRLLDDGGQVPDFLHDTKEISLGLIVGGKESGQELSAREMSNKIVHSRELIWDLELPRKPRLICISNQPERWESAEIDILELALLCKILMS